MKYTKELEEKIRSLFFHILKDIKNEFNQPVTDIESQKISEQISAMKQQVLKKTGKTGFFRNGYDVDYGWNAVRC